MKAAALALLLAASAPAAVLPGDARDPAFWGGLESRVAAHPGKSGVYVLEKGEEALLARAWTRRIARIGRRCHR